MNECMHGGRGLGELGEKRRDPLDRDLGQIPRVLAKQTAAKKRPLAVKTASTKELLCRRKKHICFVCFRNNACAKICVAIARSQITRQKVVNFLLCEQQLKKTEAAISFGKRERSWFQLATPVVSSGSVLGKKLGETFETRRHSQLEGAAPPASQPKTASPPTQNSLPHRIETLYPSFIKYVR